MTELKLKTVFQTFGHTKALKDGTVRVPGVAFDFEEVPVIIQAFRRMVRGLEFDVTEMAATTYLAARAHGKRFTALPVFVVRAFHHGAIFYNTKSGIRTPKDLEGKKVGVNRGYTVTTGVWARSILQHEHGVDLAKVTWVLSGDEHVAKFRPPANVVSAGKDKTLEDMLIAGEIAAAIGIQTNHPDIAPLIPAPDKAAFQALARDGHYPINHLIVVKDELLAAHPDLAPKLFEGFAEAKRLWLGALRAGTAGEPGKGEKVYRQIFQMTGEDPLPYGIQPNRKILESLIGYATEQGILSRPVAVEELFAAGTAGLTA
jgi:ABC-type nitrate/sulfonate/bicarbonate transport system substrate-binding protein